MSVLFDVRTKLSKISVSELSIVENQPALLELWKNMQVLREEMNQAKKEAAANVALPYIETMDELEKKYAFLLKLIS